MKLVPYPGAQTVQAWLRVQRRAGAPKEQTQVLLPVRSWVTRDCPAYAESC